MVTKEFWRHPDLIVPSSLALLATGQTYRDSQALVIIYFLYCCDKHCDQKQEQVYTTLHFQVRKRHRVMSGQESQVMNLEAEPEADITEEFCLLACFPWLRLTQFSVQPRTPAQGMVSPTVGWTFPHRLTIQASPHTLGHRPV